MHGLALPPALVALAAFASGLAAGLAGAGAAGAVVGAMGAAAGLRFGPGAAPVALVLATGSLHGTLARRIDSLRCAARLPDGPVALVVRVVEPTAGRVPALVRPEIGCGGAVQARFGADVAVEAGERHRVEARWIAGAATLGREDGLLAVRGTVLLDRHPTPVERLRNWLHRTNRELYGHRAGMIDALMLGRRSAIEPALNAMFARSGLVHLLSISGFHVGLIGGWLFLCLRAARMERQRARFLATVGVTCYVAFIGAPAPALRAATLVWLAALAAARQRQPAPGPLFALTALIVLVLDPFALVDLGAWLSVTALWGATTWSRWSDGAISRAWWCRIVSGSIGATLGTAPAAALVLGSIAPIGVLVNLVAIPVAGLAVPGVLASLVLAAAHRAAGAGLAAGSGLLLDVMEGVAELGARLPGALLFEPGPGPMAFAAAMVLVGAWVIGRRNTLREAGRRASWVAAVALAAHLVVLRWGPAASGTGLTLHFLNVGQGDAIAIQTPRSRWVLVDAGPRDRDQDAGRRVVVPFLLRNGARSLEALILSHAHLDHYGGATAVLDRIRVGAVLEPGVPSPDQNYHAFLDAVERSGARWGALRAGDRFELDGVEFAVLHPDTTWRRFGEDLNEDSVILRLRTGGFEVVLGGDAGLLAEEWLAGRVGAVEVLKVGHHGSRTATGSAWLAELRPLVAVMSVGPNGYGHPAPATVGRLGSAGVELWRTDRDGTISILVDETGFRVRGRRGEQRHPLH